MGHACNCNAWSTSALFACPVVHKCVLSYHTLRILPFTELQNILSWRGAQLLALCSTTQNSISMSESVIEMPLELQQLGATTIALGKGQSHPSHGGRAGPAASHGTVDPFGSRVHY